MPSYNDTSYFQKWALGVIIDKTFYYDPSAGQVGAVIVTYVYPGWSAAYEGIQAGDTITRVDGTRIENVQNFVSHVSGSATGKVTLRVRDWHTGAYINTPGIQLVKVTGGGGVGGGGNGP